MKAFTCLGATVLCAGLILAAPTASAQAVSEGGVTVVRGVDAHEGAQTRRSSREGGATVFRGTRGPTPAEAAAAPVSAPPAVHALAGKNLWFVDPQRTKVTACSLQYDVYGQRQVGCTSDRY